MNELKLNLTPDSINGLERKLKHVSLLISEDLEMEQRAKVEYQKDGISINDAIGYDTTLTASQKEQRKRMYQNISYGSNTKGTMVDPTTGAEIQPGPSGYDPEVTMVSELTFWQNLPAAFFSKQNLDTISTAVEWKEGNTLAALVYNGLLFSMLKMAQRERV